jgi:hypothetical protein
LADLNKEQLHRLARLGAQARLEELRKEEAAIRHAFQDLFGGRGRRAASASSGESRHRRRMSTAARRAVSERMKKYWAERRRKTK